jgi:hypothetical protein
MGDKMQFAYIEDEDIKKKLFELIDSHVNQENVYRLIRGNSITPEEFLPSLIDPHQIKCIDTTVQKNYSCSLFIERTLESKIQLPYYKEQFNYVARGKTDNFKGISPLPNFKGHIDYYLFDYVEQNPSIDFHLWKEILK